METKTKKVKKAKVEREVNKIMAEHLKNRKKLLSEKEDLVRDTEIYRP